MQAAIPCPDRQEYERLIQGELTPPDVERVSQHLAGCSPCAATVQTLLGEDTLLSAVRGTGPAPTRGEEVPAELVQRLVGLAASAATTAAEATSPLAPPQAPDELGRLAHFRVLKVLGQGGMGVVFLTEDTLLQRTVALKTMKPERAAEPRHRQRFLREARAAAKVEHDHIVPIYGVGEDRGVPWLAMPLLKGQTLEDLLKRAKVLKPAQVVRLGAQVARGLAAAHEAGLVHRDVKPANIWVEPEGGGRVKLLDFGLARDHGPDPEAAVGPLTREGTVIGTPAYMAPEQARGEAVDTRADLFSLGCVLYRALTGRLPFQGDGLMGTLLSLAADTPPAPHEVNPAVPRPLSELIVTLLAKDRSARPASAKAVVAALEALQEKPPAAVPVALHVTPRAAEAAPPVAVPAGMSQRAIPRRRWRVAVAATLVLAVGGVLAGQIIIRVRDRDGKDIAEYTVPEGGSVMIINRKSEKKPSPDGTSKAAALDLQPQPLPPLKGGEPISDAGLVRRPAEIKGVRTWTIETVRPRGGLYAVAYSPDGKLIATGGADGVIRLLDNKGQLVRALAGHGRGLSNDTNDVSGLAWHKDGQTLASKTYDGTVRLWNAKTATPLRTIVVAKPGTWMAGPTWSPDGKTLAVAISRPDGGRIDLIDPSSDKVRTGIPDLPVQGGITAIAWSPNGKTFAFTSWQGYANPKVGLCDVGSTTVKNLESGKGIEGWVAWSSDGKRVYAGRCCWGVASGRRLWEGKHEEVIALSPDGKKLLAASGQFTSVALVSAETGETIQAIPGPAGRDVMCFAGSWSRDSKRVVTGLSSGMLRYYDAASGEMVTEIPGLPSESDRWPAWSPDGQMIAGAIGRTAGYVFDTGSGKLLSSPVTQGASFVWSSDGRLAVGVDGGILIQQGSTAKRLALVPGPGAANCPASWSPDGKVLATNCHKSVHFLDARSGKKLFEIEGAYTCVGWSPDGKRISMSGRGHGIVQVHDAVTGKRIHVLEPNQGGTCWAYAWSPDGKWRATGWEDGAIRIWDPGMGEVIDTLRGHRGRVTCVAWTKDGKALLSDSGDGTHRVWDIATGFGRVRPGTMLTPSPDLRFAAVGHLNTMRLHEIASNRPVGVFMALPDNRYVSFSPEGHYRGSRNVERDLVYVVQMDDGVQHTLTPAEFAKKYNWKNDPEKVKFVDAPPPRAESSAAPKAAPGTAKRAQVRPVQAVGRVYGDNFHRCTASAIMPSIGLPVALVRVEPSAGFRSASPPGSRQAGEQAWSTAWGRHWTYGAGGPGNGFRLLEPLSWGVPGRGVGPPFQGEWPGARGRLSPVHGACRAAV
jgi:WD40 repeat protein/tRNA A-37 threonylcarbamoyl transferase component Bud32